MELPTPEIKTRWSLGDLQNYCKEIMRSFNTAIYAVADHPRNTE
jgi:hypothetical protein